MADRQIRGAAAQAAPRLDVRGPVSRALAGTGVTLPPDDGATEAAPPALVPARTPARTPAPRTYGPPARRVTKPFEPAPWPTQRSSPAQRPALSGLTADERRVHRILIDTLDVTAEHAGGGLGGLTYGDRQRLEALDLAFLNAQIAGRDRNAGLRQTLALAGLAAGLVAALVTAIVGTVAAGLGLAVASVAAAAAVMSSGGPASGQRRRILLALRELALLAHDDRLASDALAQADRLIDHLADADEASTTPTRSRVRA